MNIDVRELFLKNPVVSAPMAGISDKAFRILARDFGAGLIYSEMVSAKALTYKNEKTFDLIDLKGEEGPIAVQLFGSDPEIMAEGARIVSQHGADIIDINMGCPVAKVVKNMEGSALMKTPDIAAKIVETMKLAVDKPISVKFRSGWDQNSINAVEFAKMMEAAGADFICLHPRTRMEQYTGHSDWNLLKEVKESVDIPVIGSGDVYTKEDFVKMRQLTNCDAVMLARGLLGNFWLIKNIKGFMEGKEELTISTREKIQTLLIHYELIEKYKGETTALKEIRKFFAWYTKGVPRSAKLRLEINRISEKEELMKFLNNMIEDDGFEIS